MPHELKLYKYAKLFSNQSTTCTRMDLKCILSFEARLLLLLVRGHEQMNGCSIRLDITFRNSARTVRVTSLRARLNRNSNFKIRLRGLINNFISTLFVYKKIFLNFWNYIIILNSKFLKSEFRILRNVFYGLFRVCAILNLRRISLVHFTKVCVFIFIFYDIQ